MSTIPSVARIMRDIVTPEGFEREIRIEPKTNWSPAIKVLVLKSSDTLIEIWFDAVGKNRSESYFLASGHVYFDTPAGRRTFDRYGVEDSFYIENPLRWTDSRIWANDRVTGLKGLGLVTESAGFKEFGPNRKNSWSTRIVVLWDDGQETTYEDDKHLKRARVKKADVIEQTNAQIKRFIEIRIPEARDRIGRSEHVPGVPFMVTAERKKTITQNLRNGQQYSFTPSGFGTGYQLWPSPNHLAKRASKELEKFFSFSPIYVSTFDAD
jgi:hypothetical protein